MPPLLRLDASEVHLWLAFESDIADPRVLESYDRLLTDEEKEKELRFHFPKHRRQYRITRALVRTVLSRYIPVPPERWRFGANEYGRPAVAADFSLDGYSFNLSHTDGLIVCGVARHSVVGADVENAKTRQVSLDIADRFFSPTEAAALRDVPPDRQQQGFFHYWTLKESYIKAKGRGLSIPLHEFSFNAPDSRDISIAFTSNGEDDDPGRWRFWLVRPSDEHLSAVCVGPLEGAAPRRLTVRRVVPLVSEDVVDCPIVRCSATTR